MGIVDGESLFGFFGEWIGEVIFENLILCDIV